MGVGSANAGGPWGKQWGEGRPLSDCLPVSHPVTALLFKMEEANLASRAKAHELIQATNQVGSTLLGQRPLAALWGRAQ